jgi:hypothetical protein
MATQNQRSLSKKKKKEEKNCPHINSRLRDFIQHLPTTEIADGFALESTIRV